MIDESRSEGVGDVVDVVDPLAVFDLGFEADTADLQPVVLFDLREQVLDRARRWRTSPSER